MNTVYRILAINPGSTSTKIAIFENEKKLFSMNIAHDAASLKEFPKVQDQLSYRKETVTAELKKAGISLYNIDIFVGRGGGLAPVQSGTFEVNEKLLSDSASASFEMEHPAQLGAQICALYQKEYGGRAFMVNPPSVDEYCDLARYTGLSDMYRSSHLHALNQKEIALRYCKVQGLAYNQTNLIICHIGGGISVTAHQKGKMVDANDCLIGEGPMMPTRSGSLPAVQLVKLAFSGKYSEKDLIGRINKTGGFIDHLGTSDAIEIEKRIESGDQKAKDVYEAAIYQVAKAVGSCACVLKGSLEAILLTGGIAHSRLFTSTLKTYIQWIAPVVVMAGEYETEALAAGALRVMKGEEEALIYTGEPVWSGF